MQKYTMQNVKNFIDKLKKTLFFILLGNKNIEETNLKKSFLLVLSWALGIIILCMLISFPLNLQLGWGFQEGRPVTWLSFFFLLLVGFISLEIYKIRKTSDNQNKNVKMWKYLGIGFIYLAFDDLLRFHEEIDHTICKIFGLDKHGPADKIDDFIIVLYGIIALFILIKYFKESLVFKNGFWFFLGAVFFAIVTTLSDLLGGMNGPLSGIISEENLPSTLRTLDIIEETTKSLAEVFFVGAFLNIYNKFKK